MFDGINMTKLMYGENAVHVGMNLIVQGVDDRSVIGVFQCCLPEGTPGPHPLMFGAEDHILILGDAVIRPHLVAHSRHLLGQGLTHIARQGFEGEAWVESPTLKLIFDHQGHFAAAAASTEQQCRSHR